MNFVFIDDLINAFPDLAILRPRTNRNRVILCQHEGELVGDNTRIGNNPANAAINLTRFRRFFELAKEQQADLALTPEYSCPKANIVELIQHPERRPAEGVLWVIGGESIGKKELVDFTREFTSEGVKIYFENGLINEANHFFDPVYYLFVTGSGEQAILQIVIQFKTKHMSTRGPGVVERNNLIEGRTIYVLRNSATSIWLMTLICSEAMNFERYIDQNARELLRWDFHPYLILNPMINPDPTHNTFINFRRFIFKSAHKELIELNWNRSSMIGCTPLLKHGNSRSGIFIASTDIDQNNSTRIGQNHRKGLYYYFIYPGLYAFLFNSNPHIFYFETPPVSITQAEGPQQTREGPQIIFVYKFDEAGNAEELPNVSDNHVQFLGDVGCGDAYFNAAAGCVLSKERLVCLTAGKIPGSATGDWHQLDKLFSIKLDQSTETNLRFTVFSDTDDPSLLQRNAFVGAINKLNDIILPNTNEYPASIAHLKSRNIRLGYPADVQGRPELYKYNVITEAGESANATICYLETPLPGLVERVFENVRKLFGIDNNNKKGVVIFYSNGQVILNKSDETAGKIFNTNEYGDSSIFKDL